MDENGDVQRSLGRIEGVQTQILSELKNFRDTLSEHTNQDQLAFSAVRVVIANQKSELATQFDLQAADRNRRLSEQDMKLDALKEAADKAKGAGYVILGLIGALATALGSMVLAVFNGWIGK